MLIVLLHILTVSCAVQGGLFSAVLTAFNVQSYQLLTPPPTTDPVIVALERISAQLSSFSVNPPSVNSTHPAFVYDPAPLPAPQYAVWLNTLWFASLICSLSAASVGIMVKQWLNEYSAGLSGKSRQIARLRQLRLNGLQRWRVKEIVAVLPILLQVASALFFAGLLVLLWQLNQVVATVSTVLVGLLVVFSLSTIVLPSIATGCAYLSPPSRAIYGLTPWLRYLIYILFDCVVRHFTYMSLPLWPSREEMFRRDCPRIYSMLKIFSPSADSSRLKWNARELHIVAKESNELDADSITTAYTTGMDTNYLHHASVCITELTLATARKCFQAIRSANIAHWGENAHTQPMRSVHPCMWSGAIISLMDAASQGSSQTSPSIAQELEDMYNSMSPDNSHVSSALSHTRLVSVDFARIICHYNHDELPSGTLNVAKRIRHKHLENVMLLFSKKGLGNDIRRQGQCTTIRLACYPKLTCIHGIPCSNVCLHAKCSLGIGNHSNQCHGHQGIP